MTPQQELQLINQAIAQQQPSFAPEEELKLINEAISQQQPSTFQQIAQPLASGARSIAASLGDASDMFINNPINAVGKALGKDELLPSVGNTIASGIDTATGNYTRPETPRQKVIESAIRGVGSLIPGVAGGNIIAKGGSQLAQQIGKGISGISEVSPANVLGTGTGAALTEGILQNNPENTIQAATTGILGNLAGQTVGSLISPGGRARAAGKALAVNPKKVQNFKDTGIDPTLGDVSDSNIVKGYQKIAEHTPGSSHITHKTRQGQLEQIGENLGKGARGEAFSEKEAGELAKEGLKNYKEKGNQVTAQLKDRYLRHLDDNSAIEMNKPLDFYLKTLTKVKSTRMRDEIAKSPLGKEMQKIAQTAHEFGGKIPWSDAEAIRTQLLDLITKQGSVGSISKGQLEHLRGLLNQEMGDYMKSIGPSAIKDWNRYNKFYSNWANKRKPLLDKAEDIHNSSAEKVFSEIIRGKKPDHQSLETINNALKDNQRKDFWDTMVNRLGQNRVGDWNANEFQKNYKKLQKETKDQLKLPLSKTSKEKFDKVMDAIGDMKLTESMANTSKTEYTKQLIDIAKTGGAATAGYAAFGTVLPVLSALGTTHALTKGMLTNPKFINWAAKGLTLKNPLQWGHHLGSGQQYLGKVGLQEMKEIINHYKKH